MEQATVAPATVEPGAAAVEAAPWRRYARRPELPALLWLAATVALGTSTGPGVPGTGLDAGWMTAINVAAAEGRRFGHDFLFTFGPWGFLERPLLVNREQFVLGILFAVGAATAMFFAAYVCLKRHWPAAVAAPVAFAVTLATPVADPGLRLLCAGLVFAFLTLQRGDAGKPYGWRDAWPTALLGAFAALMSQVKFSEGLAFLALAGVVAVSVRSFRALAWNAGAGLVALSVGFVLVWLVAGQRLGDLAGWLRGSWQLTSGYQEAMAIERPDHVVGYLLAALSTLVAGALAVRTASRLGGVPALGVVLLLIAVLEFGFKHGFTRHDTGHEPTFFIVAGFALIALATFPRRPVAALAAVALVVGIVPRDIGQFDPFSARDRWRTSVEAVLNDGFRAQLQAQGQSQARDRYGLPARMVAETAGHPVSVDPWEAALPWAYSMNWRPVPVFQSYSAYTRSLDELNARAIAGAPADQIVLREAVDPIDERNGRWETPSYLLALACDYTVSTTEDRWSLLRHGTNRCRQPRTVGVREVHAGEAVEPPVAASNEILVVRFMPRPDGPLTSLSTIVLKDWSTLTVAADGRRFRLPEGLAGGPLMVAFPASLGWAAPFDGFQYRRLAFGAAGRLEFQVIAVR